MKANNICFASKTIDIAEHDLYLELTTCMCYYDAPNLNDVELVYKDYEESALECAKTLINMPVQAKYKKINNLDDLGSHEVHLMPNGDVEFGTESVGVNTDVWIDSQEVTTVDGVTKTLPCLFSKKRIWKRNTNLVNAIKRLYESEKGLGSSWEISTLEYVYKEGIKKLTKYEFLGDCLLGSTTTPAFNGTSKALSLSAMTEQELMVAEALTIDLSNNQEQSFNIKINHEKEENILKDVKEVLSSDNTLPEEVETENVETTETENVETNTVDENETNPEDAITEDLSESTSETEENELEISEQSDIADENNSESVSETEISDVEVSALTSYDLRCKLNEACRNMVNDWCWVAYLFPEEHYVLCEFDGESELEYLKFTYTVNGNEVSVSEPEKVTLSISVSSINDKISEYENIISEKDELIINASSEITSLKAQITELSQYKDKLDEIEQKKAMAELAEKKELLISTVVKSGQITREEIEASEELTEYVNNLDKKSLMAIVGERLSASVDTLNEIETSEVNTDDIHMSSNLNSIIDDENVDIDMVSIFRKSVLGK